MTKTKGSILNIAYAVDEEGRLIISPESAINITATDLIIDNEGVELKLDDLTNTLISISNRIPSALSSDRLKVEVSGIVATSDTTAANQLLEIAALNAIRDSVGNVSVTPTANTVQARLSNIQTLLSNIGTNTANVTTNGLTDAQLRATPVPVSLSNSQVEVSNDVGNPLPVLVTGGVTSNGLTDSQLRATPVPVLISNSQVEVINDVGNPLPVTGNITISGGTVNVSGGLTDSQLRATPVPVSLSNSSVEISNDVGNPIPVSGAVLISNPTITVTASSSTPVSVSLATTTEAKLDNLVTQLTSLLSATNPEKLDWSPVVLTTSVAGSPWVIEGNAPNTTMYSIGLNVTNIGTDLIARIEGSTDGTNYFNLAADEADSIITANGTYGFNFTGKLKRIRPRIININGGTPSATFTLLTG